MTRALSLVLAVALLAAPSASAEARSPAGAFRAAVERAWNGGGAPRSVPASFAAVEVRRLAPIAGQLDALDGSAATTSTILSLGALPDPWIAALASTGTRFEVGAEPIYDMPGWDWTRPEILSVGGTVDGAYSPGLGVVLSACCSVGLLSFSAVHEVVHVLAERYGWNDDPHLYAQLLRFRRFGGLDPAWAGSGIDPGRGEMLADAVAMYLTEGRSAVREVFGSRLFERWVRSLVLRPLSAG